MRTALYILLLVTGSFSVAAVIQYAFLLLRIPPRIALLVGGYLPYVLFAVRGYIWFKRGKVTAPDSFTGFPLVASWGSLVLLALVAGAYAALIAANAGQGLSGVPLGMLLVLLAPVAAIAVSLVELRDWASFRRARRIARSRADEEV